ncbi:tail fiber domain-containing protein, partial [Shouchella clausii]|uniref:tail fiber domain-containing protein n=1 Tax=Shouchella clausii TaxID=79880 RepID=UPI00226C96C2
NPNYRPIRASSFEPGSSLSYKQNIEPVDYSVLPIIDKLGVVSYNLNSDVDAGIYHNKQIGVIAELSPEVATSDGKAINLYKLATLNTKAIQELHAKINELEAIVHG